MGSAWDPASRVTPFTQPPGRALTRALTTLDEGEEWLLEPRRIEGRAPLWSPGIKLGVRRGSFFHRTECFGPVLGLMRAADLDEAVDLANDQPFGLTSGLQSLDDREAVRWMEGIEAGNLYVNRSTTGAIVGRQPFGGWKGSSVGAGAKAGGRLTMSYLEIRPGNVYVPKKRDFRIRGVIPMDALKGERALREYEIDAPEEATLLDCLDIVKDQVDGSLAYRKSCRMMICGSCGMRMDGGAVLACKTRMYEIAQAGQGIQV